MKIGKTAVLLAIAIVCSGWTAFATADGHSAKSNVEFLNGGGVLPSGLPFSEAVRVGNTLYLSGQLGLVPGTDALAKGGIRAETRQTMENIRAIVEKHGYGMNDLVKCLVMLKDIDEWGTFNEEYRKFFSQHFPARSAFAASGLALNARVEVECIAAK